MPRPRSKRRIYGPPRFSHFKPVGVPRRLLGAVTLTVDEYEAIRLADYEGLEQQPASERMGISRSTFSRLVDAARRKLAESVVEGKELRIEGGAVDLEHTLRRCRDCGDEQLQRAAETAGDREAAASCDACGSDNVEDLAHAVLGPGYGRRHTHGRRQGRS